VIVNGRLYRRDQFAAAERVTFKDWALWLLILLGFVASAALTIALLVGLLWWVVVAIRGLRGMFA
jgi:hypothetical protein